MDQRALGKYFDNADSLFQLFNGTSALFIVCDNLGRGGVIARLVEGPASAAELAGACGLPEPQLSRMLDYLAAHGVVERAPDGIYHPTERTRVLHGATDYIASTNIGVLAGSRLLDALRAGDGTPFELYYGQPVFEYFGMHPDKAATFGSFMGWMTRRFLRFLIAEHRFEAFATVCDVGGSMGDLLLAILGEYPSASGVLFDLPDTVGIAAPQIAASPLADRVEVVGGSFFEAVPAADLYTLKQILHDWNDHECARILGNIRRAINPGGRLAEFEALFAQSGFRLDRVTRNPAGHSVIEAAPV